jgi:lysosomal acid lipase/cholesteryl ester hydrolase
LETHIITTEDGYILTLFRIPGPSGSSPVFLQHGLLESSTSWLIPGRNKSLGNYLNYFKHNFISYYSFEFIMSYNSS